MKNSYTSLSLSHNRKYNLFADLKKMAVNSEKMKNLDDEEVAVPDYLTQRVMDFVAAYSVVQPVKNNIPAIEIIQN